jgi:hypothetical protein
MIIRVVLGLSMLLCGCKTQRIKSVSGQLGLDCRKEPCDFPLECVVHVDFAHRPQEKRTCEYSCDRDEDCPEELVCVTLTHGQRPSSKAGVCSRTSNIESEHRSAH